MSHHKLNETYDECTCSKDLVFVMEALDDKKKKKNTAKPTANGFGSKLNISKFKGNTKFTIAFRCRLVSEDEFFLA